MLVEADPVPAMVLSPARAGRHVAIRPVMPTDHQWLYELAVMTDRGAHWRLQGTVPNFDQFLQVLYGGTNANFVMERTRDGAAFGLCQLFEFDPLARTAQLSAMMAPGFDRKGWPLEGVFLYADYVFHAYALRKLYLESLEDEAQQYQSGLGKLFRLEGKRIGHKLVYGRYVDSYTFAAWRNDFMAARADLLPVVTALQGGPGGGDDD